MNQWEVAEEADASEVRLEITIDEDAQAWGQALADLREANRAVSVADDAIASAMRDKTEALNRVNEAQKRIDELYAVLRAGAHSSSDWNRALVED